MGVIADGDVVAKFQFAVVWQLTDDATRECGFAFAVATDECNFFAAFQLKINVFQNYFLAECLGHVRGFHYNLTRARRGRKFEVDATIVLQIHRQPFHLVQHLDARLHLVGFGWFVTEFFDEILGVLDDFLLVFVGCNLLLTAFLAEFEVFCVRRVVVVNLAERNLYCSAGYVVQECAVVAYQNHCARVVFQEIFEPLD